MSLVVMGSSFKTATIEARENYAVPRAELGGFLDTLTGSEGVDEAVVLSTCNRVEAYVNAKTDRMGIDALTAAFADHAGGAFDQDDFFLHRGMDTVDHAFKVVCSLDSQLLGEAQILGQMKNAYEAAVEHGSIGEYLTKLFKDALHLGKQVRSETSIGGDTVSLSTTAFKVLRNTFGDLEQRCVLVIGTGEMARLAANYLKDGAVGTFLVTSRTFANALAFASEFGAQPVPLEERYAAIAKADAVFTMTSSPDPVIEPEPLAQAMADRPRGKDDLLIIDEAVPRDVAAGCEDVQGVKVYNLETLNGIIDEGMAERMAAVGDVERMIGTATQEFFSWMQQRLVAPTIKEIYEKADDAVSFEMARAVKSFANLLGRELSAEEQKVLEAYGNSISKKILHGPTMRLRRESGSADSYYYTGAARYLFGLDAFPVGTVGHRHCCSERHCEQGVACPQGHPPLTAAEIEILKNMPKNALTGWPMEPPRA